MAEKTKWIAELKAHRAAAYDAGEDSSLGAAIRAVAQRHNQCPECNLKD